MEIKTNIETLLTNRKLVLSGPLVLDPTDVSVIYAPIVVVTGPEGRRSPSGKVLSELRNLASVQGVSLRFIAVEPLAARPFEASLRAGLLNSFPNAVRNVFVSDGDEVHIWIERKTNDEKDDKGILNYIEISAVQSGISRYEVHKTSDNRLPNKLRILGSIRRSSPVSFHKLKEILKDSGSIVPSDAWLNHKLDSLRKAGFVIRKGNSEYSLSLGALYALGSGKRWASPDVTRFLALARGD